MNEAKNPMTIHAGSAPKDGIAKYVAPLYGTRATFRYRWPWLFIMLANSCGPMPLLPPLTSCIFSTARFSFMAFWLDVDGIFLHVASTGLYKITMVAYHGIPETQKLSNLLTIWQLKLQVKTSLFQQVSFLMAEVPMVRHGPLNLRINW